VARDPLLLRTGWKRLGVDRRLPIKFLTFCHAFPGLSNRSDSSREWQNLAHFLLESFFEEALVLSRRIVHRS
jgi:hypothetical protein